MFFAALAVLVHALGVAYALDYVGAMETGFIGLDPRGWSPMPTPAPYYNLYRRRLQKRDLTDTCAIFNDEPITCPPNEYCAYNGNLRFMACCSVDANGDFVSDCYYTTSCVDIAESSSICGVTTGCIGFQTGICGKGDSYPECVTIVLTYGIAAYTTFQCGTTAAYVTASSPPPSPPTTTTTTITTTSKTSSTTTPPPSSTTTSVTSTSPAAVIQKAEPNHTAAIVGGAVGGVAGVLIIAGIIGFVIYRIRVKRREAEYADDAPEMPGTAHIPK
ncbi:uncharacterized protein PV07_03785 [Cladophialophora immunda]|uniref:Mid2 domain-containing protein n=1 Tax=Cladophialophora immunda TaxID=569365 RepID=A0A0D2CQH8_9EURO|nr:uncharacterized protein PV07_03785 [Cladophialophora immunda]KIW32225.1 hypothetical protein PV07_03785 [Cladophialophora immunda]OQV03649.1 hypothetical protein CLAIMM_08666 [Cladophialophora immunda]